MAALLFALLGGAWLLYWLGYNLFGSGVFQIHHHGRVAAETGW
jgi:hypothetical protein